MLFLVYKTVFMEVITWFLKKNLKRKKQKKIEKKSEIFGF